MQREKLVKFSLLQQEFSFTFYKYYAIMVWLMRLHRPGTQFRGTPLDGGLRRPDT